MKKHLTLLTLYTFTAIFALGAAEKRLPIKAYRESGGSMKALLTSLLTSDAFLYRKVAHNREGK